MKRFLFGITIFLLYCSFVFSQEMNESAIEPKNREFEAKIRSEERSSVALQKQIDSLAFIIQELKTDKDFNIFERQRLEQLLKESQKLDIRLSEKRQGLAKIQQDYQEFLGEAIAWYDLKIQKLLASVENNKLNTEEKQKRFQELIQFKESRKEYSRRLQPQSPPAWLNTSIEIQESDSYDKIIQKADLVKDQEDKVRKQLALFKKHAKEAENELMLRRKMNELISDTYLMEHQSETFIATAPTEKGRMTDVQEGVYNTEISPELEILMSNYDNLINSDVSEFSAVDLEFYMKNLNAMISNLARSADSLKLKAEKFDQSAEKKRKDERK